MKTEYYVLQLMTENDKPSLMTAAVRSCDLCATIINGMGGPGSGSICIPCGELLKQGKLRGAIKWEQDA